MGCYIDPKESKFSGDITKEDFLANNALEIDIPSWPVKDDSLALVCLVDNKPIQNFTAAAVAFDERELERFLNPNDTRKKRWFLLPKYLITKNVMIEPHIEILKRMGFLK